jgi:hypothetical protein
MKKKSIFLTDLFLRTILSKRDETECWAQDQNKPWLCFVSV